MTLTTRRMQNQIAIEYDGGAFPQLKGESGCRTAFDSFLRCYDGLHHQCY